MVALDLILDATAPLSALLYPLLPPSTAHHMLAWLGILHYVLHCMRVGLWLSWRLEPFPQLTAWIVILRTCLMNIGFLGLLAPSFRHLQPEDAWEQARLLIIQCLLWWLPYCAVFRLALSLDSPYRYFSIWCCIVCFVSFARSIPTYFRLFTRPLSVVFSRLAARRVRWLFRFRREDIEANAGPLGDMPFEDASESQWVDKSEDSAVLRSLIKEKGNLV
ncbi:hypothetical protein J3F83DRAFT_735840 [Trichoderma novae-zelandiae]